MVREDQVLGGVMKIYKRPYPRFAVRTIRQGKVKIRGQWFYPWGHWQKYDGRLDGMKYAFGLYYTGTEGGFICEGFAALWGPEQHFLEPDTDKWGPDPQVMPDATTPWVWWATKQHRAEEEARLKRLQERDAEWERGRLASLQAPQVAVV